MHKRYLRYELLEDRRLLAAGALLEIGDIVSEIQRWKELAFGHDSGSYVAPSASERAQFGALAEQLRDGDLSTAVDTADALDYELVEFLDNGTGTTFYQLREQLVGGVPTRGWGTYFVNLGFQQDDLVEVPHPIFDTNSWDIGAKVFRDSGARGFLMAGAHRHANGTGTADVAHLDESIFQSVHEAWTGESTPWQIHGFALSKHDGDSEEDLFPAGTDMVLSNGDGSISPEVVDLDGAFGAQGFLSYSYNTLAPHDPLSMFVNDGVDGTTFSSLAATTNIQGIATRDLGGTFVHVELEQSIRFDAANRDAASALIGESLSAATFFAQTVTVDDSNLDLLWITVDFNSQFDASTLQSADMTINGVAAETVTQTDSDTAIFEFAPLPPGSYTATMLAGSVQELSQTGLNTFHLPFDVTPPTTKFFVVDTADDNTFEYDVDGDFVESYSLTSGNNAPRGAAADAAGDTVWVLDNDDFVYVYDAAGNPLGQWKALGLSRPEGIATDGEDIWIVDRGTDRVYFFDNAAGQTSGSLTATSSFALAGSNGNPRGVTTDGTHLWVVNSAGKHDKVFKYTAGGSLSGSWKIDSANANPRGITIDPGNVDHVWIVDNSSDQLYQYNGAANHTSGTHAASAIFALTAGNTNPQGIADPPPPSSAFLSMDSDVRRRTLHNFFAQIGTAHLDRWQAEVASNRSREIKGAELHHEEMGNTLRQPEGLLSPPVQAAREEVFARYTGDCDSEQEKETAFWPFSDAEALERFSESTGME